MTKRLITYSLLLLTALLVACAKMGQPDGGWYDETPPAIVGSTPGDKATNVTTRKVSILFDEFIQVDNPTEKVVISPPQLETPDIKGAGKKIVVELKDSLKQNTTYTIDFSDAISDNNEGNPLGNYAYTFSTGDHIDTLEVAGYVLEAQNLEPIKGILVGLYADVSDSAFTRLPMLRVSRTDSRGRFVIKGIAPGTYRCYALADADNNYMFSQKSEKLAFNHDIIVPTFKPDVRQDTIWRDSLRIDSIVQVKYTHFLPDDIVLRAFTEIQTDRFLVKTERPEPDRFSLFFSYGSDSLPTLRGLNFDEQDAFIVEAAERNDTITYWLRDTTLVNQDTLRMQLSYMMTDSLGVLQPQTDTLEILAKVPYEKRMKLLADKREEWQKKQDKAKKRGKPYETKMAADALNMQLQAKSEPAPDENVLITLPSPVARIDTAAIHLYAKHDTLWYNAPFVIREKQDRHRTYELLGEWRPGIEYSLELDTMAFTDIYGKATDPLKQGFKVKSDEAFSTLLLNLTGMADTTVVVQLLGSNDEVKKQVTTRNGTAEFFYVNPGEYYLRMFIDSNGDGQWTTGEYAADRQPETTCYYPQKVECKAKWDITLTWNPADRQLYRQKPMDITKQKPEKEKIIRKRNLDRAKKMGLALPEHLR